MLFLVLPNTQAPTSFPQTANILSEPYIAIMSEAEVVHLAPEKYSSGESAQRPIAEAHEYCYQLFNHLVNVAQRSQLFQPDKVLLSQLLDELDRYQLWAGNVGAGHQKYMLSLDCRLEEASFYKDQVCNLILSFGSQTK